MRSVSSDVVLQSLYDLVESLDDGARLPTVRDMMRRFRVSQSSVQEAFARLREENLVTSRVGRGSFVTKAGATGVLNGTARNLAPFAGAGRGGDIEPESLLILSNASMNERCMLVQNQIMAEMMAVGGKVVQMSYNDTDHLMKLLRTAPSFDAVILQSHYEFIPVRLLSMLQQKTRALVVDGHTLSGVDIDHVGTDWEHALALGFDHLAGLGHHHIGLVSLNSSAQPIMSVRRAFSRTDNWRGIAIQLSAPILLEGVLHPTQRVDDSLGQALERLRSAVDRLPFTALMFIGISDGPGIRHSLDRLGILCPADLSVYLLGHTNVPTEHSGHFTMAGSTHEDAASELMAAIRRRLRTPAAGPSIRYLDCREIVRSSTAEPARPAVSGAVGRAPHALVD